MKYFARQVMQANTTICPEHLKNAVFAQGQPGDGTAFHSNQCPGDD